MPTVRECIKRLFPSGTNPKNLGSIDACPEWPPDVFAVTAVLLDRAGCYADPIFTGGGPEVFHHPREHPEYKADVLAVAEGWSSASDEALRAINVLWGRLLESSERLLHDHSEDGRRWWPAAFELMMIADESFRGVGFLYEDEKAKSPFADFFLAQYLAWASDDTAGLLLTSIPFSLCFMVPFDEVCVQPKTATARVGCTLRSLSHHLSLLPSIGEVSTEYHPQFVSRDQEKPDALRPGAAGLRLRGEDRKPLNLLVVPFPYRISNLCFRDHSPSLGGYLANTSRLFDVRQRWLLNDPDEPDRDFSADHFFEPADFVDFLADLLAMARREVGEINGIILPELALDRRLVDETARLLAANPGDHRLDLFISGYSDIEPSSSLPTNNVFVARLDGEGRYYLSRSQKKHHRWKLTGDQIRRYHLGDALNPQYDWWERIDISGRSCIVHAFRHRASLVALVCEDLARIDPVQTVIRSVGPNLVVALLMDGPQLERRWSGRYATVLADDPGSAVLTLTSLGFIRRSSPPGGDESRQIGLWKEIDGESRELRLPAGAHALLLTLSTERTKTYSIDGRSDHRSTVKLSLSGQHAILSRRFEEMGWKWADPN